MSYWVNTLERLKELRVERKMTQQQLGDKINVSRGAVFG